MIKRIKEFFADSKALYVKIRDFKQYMKFIDIKMFRIGLYAIRLKCQYPLGGNVLYDASGKYVGFCMYLCFVKVGVEIGLAD